MYILTDSSSRVAKVNVVSVDEMFQNEISKTKWSYQWTNDAVTYCYCKYGYDPGILYAIVKFEGSLLFD